MMTQKKIENDYAVLSQELAELLTRMEDGELSVDEAVNRYQRGLEIIKLLEHRLARAENQVSQLRADLDSSEEE